MNNRLSFSDVLVNELNETFSTDTYRILTYTGLGIKFERAINFKLIEYPALSKEYIIMYIFFI